jgi:predicted nucleic acid-binding protein
LSNVVLDASIVAKWFKLADEDFLEEALALRARFRSGELSVFVPTWFPLELINPACRSWRWPVHAVRQMVQDLLDLHWTWEDPDFQSVLIWASRGLTAYDGVYVALAETIGAPLVTADAQILKLAPGIALSLSEYVTV